MSTVENAFEGRLFYAEDNKERLVKFGRATIGVGLPPISHAGSIAYFERASEAARLREQVAKSVPGK